MAEDDVVVDGIAAQVGASVVLLSDVERAAAPIERRMLEAGAPASQIAMLRAQALEKLIETEIVASVVERTDLGASDEEVTNAIGMIARNEGLSFDQLVEIVTAHGSTVEDYRAQIRQEIERSKVVNAMVRSRVHIEPDDVRNLFLERYGDQPTEGGEQIRLLHILVSSGAGAMRSQESACGELEAVRTRITNGDTSFENAARSVSDFKAEVGGDLGWLRANDLAAWMVPAVNALEAGQMSAVLPMNFGCNLLMVSERRMYRPTSFGDVQGVLERELIERETAEEYALWVDKMREQTYIERKGIFAETTRLQEGSGGSGRRP